MQERTLVSELIERWLGKVEALGKTRWMITGAILSLSAFFVFNTNHPEWLIRVGVLGIGLVAFFFFSRTETKWVVTLGVLSLSFVLIFYRLGEGSLYDWDEAIYAQVSKEMFLDHRWGSLTWNAVPFLQKPPLQFWLTSLTYSFIGVNEFAARFWAALFGFGVVALTFFFGCRLCSWAVGAAAALLLLSVDHEYFSHLYNFLSLARVGMLETPLIFWITLSLLLGWEARNRPWLLSLVGIPVGLAVMTKAWLGLFPVIILIIVEAFGNRLQGQRKFWVISALFATIIVLPWHVWELWQNGKSFIHDYFAVNLFGRVTGTIEENHQYPSYYLNVISLAFPFWKYFLPPSFVWAVCKALKTNSQPQRFLLTWIATPLILLSLSQTKLGWYISVIYPALALLLAIAMTQIAGHRMVVAAVAIIMALCCVRLPIPSDGSPNVKHFANTHTYFSPNSTVYVASKELPCPLRPSSVYEHNYYDSRVPPALLFYMNRPLTCVQPDDANLGLRFKTPYVVFDELSDKSMGSITIYVTD